MADVAPAANLPEATAAEPVIDDNEEDETKEILLMKQRVEEMEREAQKLKELQAAAESANGGGDQHSAEGSPMETEDDKALADSRSVFVGNVSSPVPALLFRRLLGRRPFAYQVDYGATPEEIQAHFQACGTINRVTILCDKFTGHPKGYAYVEFTEPDHIDAALALDNSLFRSRLIKLRIGCFNDKRRLLRKCLGNCRTALPPDTLGHLARVPDIYRDQQRALPSHIMSTQCLRIATRVASRAPARAMSTASAPYAFNKLAIIPPPARAGPTASLRNGKGLMAYLQQTLPTPEKQTWIQTLFSRRHPDRLLPGSVLTVTLTHAPVTFSGVLISVRRRGPDTSFVVRNVVQRTGVEMQFFVNSPHVKAIQVVQKAGGGRAAEGKRKKRVRQAKLFYLRDAPDKMSALSTGVRK
ncbi:hypothetical protein EWM64_g178 [Hericium alpestre]|uniref:RRM domain-containing protein n=1 Tax=Hericium alpestre TaxID=135208 RepID=A0A4Z0AC17_9AGAM|nr:hypothetical protein EWM64_g178 [Hericium alpestre]